MYQDIPRYTIYIYMGYEIADGDFARGFGSILCIQAEKYVNRSEQIEMYSVVHLA